MIGPTWNLKVPYIMSQKAIDLSHSGRIPLFKEAQKAIDLGTFGDESGENLGADSQRVGEA